MRLCNHIVNQSDFEQFIKTDNVSLIQEIGKRLLHFPELSDQMLDFFNQTKNIRKKRVFAFLTLLGKPECPEARNFLHKIGMTDEEIDEHLKGNIKYWQQK